MEHISHEDSAKDETFEMAPSLPGPPQPAKENSPEVQMEVQIPSLPESQQFLSDDEDDRPEENSENNMLAALNGDFDAQMNMQENIEFTNDNFTENVGSDAMDVSNNIVPENPGLILESEVNQVAKIFQMLFAIFFSSINSEFWFTFEKRIIFVFVRKDS